jgi:hypothetical protein
MDLSDSNLYEVLVLQLTTTISHHKSSQVITGNEDSCSSDCVPPGSIIKIKNISTGSNADAYYKSTGIVRHTTQ